MLAIECFPSLTRALQDGREQPLRVDSDEPVSVRSIGDRQATAMALHAVRASSGDVVCVSDAAVHQAWSWLARRGWLVELSSASVLAGLDALVERAHLDDASTVVLVLTAGPYAQESLGDTVRARRVTDPIDPDDLRGAVAGPA